jgi:hypothetical protein
VKQNCSPAGFAFNPASFSSITGRLNLKCERSRASQIRAPPLGFVEFERFAKRVVQLLFVSSVEASEPRVRNPSKTQLGACSEPLPVRLAPRRQAIADALAGQICHG